MATGLCECGCGAPTTRIKKSCRRRGDVAGQYRRYRQGHQIGRGPAHMNWRGGFSENASGYRFITAGVPNPKPVHVAVVEAALGHSLRSGAPVHHVDRDPANNAPSNLVACDSHAYHMLLHQRQRAFDACGDASAERCVFCGGYDRRNEMSITFPRAGGRRAYHRSCNAAAMRAYKAKRRSVNQENAA